jgi:hypothetical protein
MPLRLPWSPANPGTAHLVEATAQQRSATGASGSGSFDPLDNDHTFRRVGPPGRREVPERTRERARTDSVVAHRANPMGRAIIDTYVGFCVGDSGLTLQCTSDIVAPVAQRFWNDPRNRMDTGRELMFRSALVMGEVAQEMMVGQLSGVTRRSPIDPTRISGVDLRDGNPLTPSTISVKVAEGPDAVFSVIDVDDMSELRTGEVLFRPMFKTLEWDTRGTPFLMPVLDWLDSYDQVLSNLIDRTAMARWLAMDVTVEGEQKDVDNFINERGGTHMPQAGTVEVHNQSVKWETMTAQTGSYEDTNTNKAVLTNVAGGAGLAKTWLAEPEDANRATSLTMAEPVRRRIGSVQNEWVGDVQTEMVRFAVDQAVAAGRLPAMVEIKGPGNVPMMVPAAETVMVTGPQIAAADAQVTAETLFNLGQALSYLTAAGALSPEASQLAAQKGWSDYLGVPYRSELDGPDVSRDDVATHVDETQKAGTPLADLLSV